MGASSFHGPLPKSAFVPEAVISLHFFAWLNLKEQLKYKSFFWLALVHLHRLTVRCTLPHGVPQHSVTSVINDLMDRESWGRISKDKVLFFKIQKYQKHLSVQVLLFSALDTI